MAAGQPSDEDRLRAYLRAGTDSLTYLDRDGVVLEINDVGVRRLGLTRDQVRGRSIYDLLPSMSVVVRARLEGVFETARTLVAEDDVPLPTGVLHFKSTLNPVFDDASNVIAVMIQSREVTAEHAVAASLVRANQKLSVIFEHSPYLIITYARGGIITYINRVGPGFAMDQVLGTDSHHFVSPEFHAAYDEVLRLLFDEGKTSKFEFLDVNNSWWEATLVPVKHDGVVEQGISFSVDITEKRRAEDDKVRLQEQMLHAQKLESLGVLAGGIAHDFNNLLFVISANTELALESVDRNSPVKGRLEDVLNASTTAADLCKQMLAYAGRGHFVVERIDLSRLVASMAQLVAVSISKGVQLKRDLAADLPVVEADPAQLRQVVLNLITNASDAIGDQQGIISLTTRRERLTHRLKSNYFGHELEAGDYVVLEVEDTGKGLDDATRARMFEPFFSTKASGRGLGLSATLGIIRRHQGSICVDSAIGVGTKIRVIFPAAKDQKQSNAARDADTAISAKQDLALVLVIDDEEGIRKVATTALSQAGYGVLSAADGRAGLARYDEHRDRIALVLLDLTMPVLSGADTLRALRDRAPDLPVIIMSGHSESTPRDKNARFLAKPFPLAKLMEAVADALRQRS